MVLSAATAAAAQAPPPLTDDQLVNGHWAGFGQLITQRPWPWGEQFYDQNASTTLDLANDCTTAQFATISVHPGLAPMLDIPRSVAVPAKTTLSIPVGIIAPPTPHPIPFPPPLGGPLDLYMDLSQYQLIIVIQGSGAPPGSGAECERQQNQLRQVTGHFHIDPTFTPPYRGPSLTPCDVWWYSGRKPPNFDEDCTDRFLALLAHYRDVTLDVLIRSDPDAWSWYPSGEQLAAMSAEEILAVRLRAEAQIAGTAEQGQ
jgi:hypothetical protein